MCVGVWVCGCVGVCVCVCVVFVCCGTEVVLPPFQLPHALTGRSLTTSSPGFTTVNGTRIPRGPSDVPPAHHIDFCFLPCGESSVFGVQLGMCENFNNCAFYLAFST